MTILTKDSNYYYFRLLLFGYDTFFYNIFQNVAFYFATDIREFIPR